MNSVWRHLASQKETDKEDCFKFKANPGSIPSEFKFNLGFIGIPNTSPKGTQQVLGHQRLGDRHPKATLSPGAESRLAKWSPSKGFMCFVFSYLVSVYSKGL